MRLSEHMKMLAGACLFALASSVSAGAVTLDFPVGNNGASLVLPEATLNNLDGGIVFGGFNAVGDFCFFDAAPQKYFDRFLNTDYNKSRMKNLD